MERPAGGAIDRRKHAIILSGGGAKGAYEIGVLDALLSGSVRAFPEKDIEPVVFTGTSVGSYNAAYLVSRRDKNARAALGELRDIWQRRIGSSLTRPNGVLRFRANPFEGLEIDRLLSDPFGPVRHFFEDSAFFITDTIQRMKNFFASDDGLTQRAVQFIDLSAFVATSRLWHLIRDTIPLPEIRANTERALVIAATNWEKGEVQLFGNVQSDACPNVTALDDKIGHLAILASTAIPGVFPPVDIFHTKYVDGGLLLNTPLSPAINALRAVAPDERDEYVLHVIYLDPDLKDVPPGIGNNTMDTLNRFAALSFATQVNRDVKRAKSINASLELVRRSPKKGRYLDPFKASIKAEYRPLTIHRYHPRDTLGGVLGLLSFESDYVGTLISRGFEDAVKHDCRTEGCIFPSYDTVETLNQKARPQKPAALPAPPRLVPARVLPES